MLLVKNLSNLDHTTISRIVSAFVQQPLYNIGPQFIITKQSPVFLKQVSLSCEQANTQPYTGLILRSQLSKAGVTRHSSAQLGDLARMLQDGI